ncbi:MAG: prephenate dehydratase domain-containing protein [Patescibacteria group bacterium]|nr:prephenate dehydratase domain-containing protein [Patescibacteria group bacterium]
MNKLKIGISGNIGSFSEEAAKYYCQRNSIKNFDLSYLISADKTLSSLEKEKIDKAIFPIENSNGGIVEEAIYAISRYLFEIENIFEIDIQHCLLVQRGVKAADIKTIASHPQALKQCKMYLKKEWKNLKLQEYSDTASAAKDLCNGVLSSDTAVIAPKICKKLYKLDIIGEGIQDLKFNFTTFVVAKK